MSNAAGCGAQARSIDARWARHYNRCAIVARRIGLSDSLYLAMRQKHMVSARVSRACSAGDRTNG